MRRIKSMIGLLALTGLVIMVIKVYQPGQLPHLRSSADAGAGGIGTPSNDSPPVSQPAVAHKTTTPPGNLSTSNLSQENYEKWAKDAGKSMCSHPGRPQPEFPQLQSRDNTNVTVVTAYFNLGTFQKGGSPDQKFSIDTYMQWVRAMLYLQNPLIVFTDFQPLADVFRLNFTGKNLKIVFLSNRSSLSAFQKLPRMAKVLSDPKYPKHHPNTVIAEYPCSQHAKADVVEQAMAWDVFRTEYFAWIDVGYFRGLLSRKRKFWIAVPPELEERKMAMCEITKPSFSLSAEKIFKNNVYWVGGGMYLGARATYSKFIAEYHTALEHFLSAGLVNTDQQVVHSMFKPDVKKALNVTSELQPFSWHGCWFYLGFHCYREQQ